MTDLVFSNGNIITPEGVLARAAISVDKERIVGIGPVGAGTPEMDLEGGWLMPGFFDTQVNGGGGVLFNDAITVDGIAAIAQAHRPFGTTALLPTLISDDLPRIAQALEAVEAAIAAGVPGVVGVHIEGPFLNEVRRGIHDPAKIRRIDADTIDLLARPRTARVMLTLAPELCPFDDLRRLAAAGVRVSAGHTDADHDRAVASFDAGVSGVTHLFNAMAPLAHRSPGLVGAALDGGRAWCGLIADGIHVHPAFLRLARRMLPPDRLMLVTDAMPSVGAPDKGFFLYGRPIQVADGMCIDADRTLAGSDLDMAQAVRNMIHLGGASPVEAATMAAANPAAFLGLSQDRGTLATGKRADWVWLDADFHPRGTWIGGVADVTG